MLMYGNEWLLIPFAVYGFAAGVIWVSASTWYNPDLSVISIIMNFPTILTFLWIFGEHFTIPVPISTWNVIVILWSVAEWSTIGFLCYRAYRLIRYIPPE